MKVIVVSHGSYARGLVDTVQMIAGKQEDLEAFGLESEESVDTLKEKIRQSIEQASQEEEILILTDIFYGSPFNTVISLMPEYDLYHVTGINLPLMMEVIMGRISGKHAEEICKELLKAAPDTVRDVRELYKEVEK
ncbi:MULTISPECIES: PTS sugar transporter subunit IIA [Anaerostipes]|jgi:PTS system mannose-specific IIA component|uniref:PTS sugar transporter subunit IIA n=1 Tax=Anaerostipes TaxID=207244 RepID=UPI0006C2E758|nr:MULTISPECIES: PTS sugar transporter subunit IIA [Anaerostipes]MBS5414652.1 PTS sugar transporter subunit IIA [Bacillota bacterium]MBT9903483.1 PTS mannose transporter subunit IIA [Anaerostipes hadrus]MCU6780783.1 PTS sugar transporter subunit IIA [Anaerostipes amylophilus]CUN68599.1 EIIAB-Man [Anaerostipes hadrus]